MVVALDRRLANSALYADERRLYDLRAEELWLGA
jgi:hypothetical protein